ncbi:hypothetical protein CC2G_013463 [Coprinopsis cinerea AmutBmut pab1-1]|nr:hypothetical protein CC2G_013463 [Coprinopsis cinerea AmutBmut pab1-1]
MSNLPPSLPVSIQNSDAAQKAYNVILELERRLLPPSQHNETHTDLGEQRNLVLCRILGYLLHYAPTEQARASVVDGIIACDGDDERVLEFGEVFLDFIRVLHSKKGEMRTPPEFPDDRRYDLRLERVECLSELPKDDWTVKKYALKRDGYRCMLTGAFDATACEQLPEILAKLTENPKNTYTETECWYILPDAMNRGVDDDHDADNLKGPWGSTVWRLPQRFGYNHILNELNDSNINRLDNVLTLAPEVRIAFDNLKIWLVPSGDPEPNTYKVEASHPLRLRKFPKVIRFQSSDPENLPLPDPRFLEIHALCAKVAHFSGATSYLDRLLRDYEDSTVLADDGSHAELLKQLLMQASPRATRDRE